MFRYQNHRFHWKNFSFQIPDGFYLDSEPEMQTDNYLWLWFSDKDSSLTLHLMDDCADTESELQAVITDMSPEWSSPIEPISINGLHGHHAEYHLHFSRYYEAMLQADSHTVFNIVMENSDGKLTADTAAVLAAIDPRLA